MYKRIVLNLILVLSLLPLWGVGMVGAAPLSQEGTTYTVQKDDSLWALAEKYLGSGPAYRAILIATNAKHEEDPTFAEVMDPSLIQPGWKLLIPSAEEATKLMVAYMPPPPKGQIVVAQTLEPTTIDPNMDTLILIQNIMANMFDPLVQFDAEMELRPALAESWMVKDPLTYEFKLRQGVAFHNGQGLTSADVKYTVEWILDEANKSKQVRYFKYIDTVETPDDYTVVVKLKEPYAPMLSNLSMLWIVPKKTIEEIGREEFAKHPIGTGPYEFVEWLKDQRLVMEAYEGYWRGVPKVQRLVWRNIPETSTRLAELRTGGVDIAIRVPVAQSELLEKDPNVNVVSVPTLRTKWVTLNTWNPPFNDKRVRQALSYAINKEEIVGALYEGNAHITGQPYAPAVLGFNPDIEPYPYDPDKAKALLAEAGYPDGFEAVLDVDEPVHEEPAQALAGQLAKIGINVKVNIGDPDQLWEKFLAKEAESMYMMHCNNILLDADFCTGLHFDSLRRGLYYNSPGTDELIVRGAAAPDREERKTIYHELAATLHEEAPVVFLWELNDVYGINKRVQWQPRSDERIWLYDASITE